MKPNILHPKLASVTAEICETLYSKGGVSKVTDYANKIGLNFAHCKPCDAEMPIIETTETIICACCGSPIKTQTIPQKIESYKIETAMGRLCRWGESNPLPFLTEQENKDFDEVGYTGKLNSMPHSFQSYLNSLNKGVYQVTKTKHDNGDFCEAYLITRVIIN